MIDYSTLKQRVVNALSVELGNEQGFDADILSVKVECVIEELIMKRQYENSSMNDAQISNDLNKYFSVVVNLSRYDYNQLGVEGQESHNENSVNRKWVNRNTYWKSVKSFIKCI